MAQNVAKIWSDKGVTKFGKNNTRFNYNLT